MSLSSIRNSNDPMFVVLVVLLMCADTSWAADTHAGKPGHDVDQHRYYMRYERKSQLSGASQQNLHRYHMRYRGQSRFPDTSISPRGAEPFDDLIMHTATSVRVDPALLRAVAHVESAFDPDAVSSKGASGLMQLMPDTARRYGVTQIFSPEQNVLGGALHLRDLLKQFKGDKRLALAAYNAGAGDVMRYNGIPPYRETQAYVRSVLALYERYRKESHARRYFRYPPKK